MDPEDSAAARSGSGRAVWLPFICLGIAGLKFWGVATDEIVARANPLDQVRYLEMAREFSRAGWPGEFNFLTLIREPGYPAWVAVVDTLGVPLRIANEILLLVAAGLFCAALRVAGASAVVTGACYALVVLEPNSLLVNRDVLPASFYLPVLLLGLAALIASARSAAFRGMGVFAAAAGLAFGLLWVTRPEKPLLLLPVGAFAAFDVFAGWRLGETRRPLAIRLAILVLAPLATAAAVVAAVAATNHHHYGIFATTDVSGPGYLAANRALLSIEQAEPRRFVPVPRDVRARAYAVSSAFRELRPVLEGPSWARGVSCKIDRVCDDIAAGYFRWMMREAANAAGHMGSPVSADRFFGRIAAEIDAACAAGALRCRPAATPFLHPYPETYVPHLHASLVRVVARALSSGDVRVWDAAVDSPQTLARVRRLFDVVANRRDALTHNGRVGFRGRAVAVDDPVVGVRLGTTVQRFVPVDVEPSVRTGSPGARGVAFEFDVAKATREFAVAAPVLEIERASGKVVRVSPLRARFEPLVRDGVTIELDAFVETGREQPLRRIARTVLWATHPPLYIALTVLGLLGAAALFRAGRRDRASDPLLGVAVVLLVWVAARIALLVLVDASSFPARRSRYLYPAVSVYGCAMLLLAEQGWRNRRSNG